MRVLVCGGRKYCDAVRLNKELDLLHKRQEITWLIHGGARGADLMADYWARANGVLRYKFLPLWDKYGKAAGSIRNQKMLEEGKPDLVVAFPGGKGTADMIKRAKAAGVRIIII